MRRTLLIGDVHGCNDELGALLKVAGWTPEDRLVLVGDLVAKGPDSAGVVQRARELGALAVLGNHDAHLLDVKAGLSKKAHHSKVAVTLRADDWRYLDQLPLWLDLPELNALVVHAGLIPTVELERQPKHVLLNMRSLDAEGQASMRVDGGVPWATRWPGPRHVVFGHDAMRGLQREAHATGLDSGCVYGRELTGLWLPEHRLVSVKAHRVWQPIDSG
ncbi:MAG: metallophosphoesterase [Archangium sp.]|nr:metallophosphoesterase [Archangium sp.]